MPAARCCWPPAPAASPCSPRCRPIAPRRPAPAATPPPCSPSTGKTSRSPARKAPSPAPGPRPATGTGPAPSWPGSPRRPASPARPAPGAPPRPAPAASSASAPARSTRPSPPPAPGRPATPGSAGTGSAPWSTPGLVETRFSPDALVWVTVVFHGTAAWRNHGLIIFPLLLYRTSVQLCCPAARPAGGDLAERAVAPGLLVLGRRAAAGAPHHPRGVVPAGPFAGGGLDLGGGFPWPQVVDDLGLVQPDDALGQRVVIRVPGRPDRRRDPCARQLGAVPDRQVLGAGVTVMDQPGHLHALPGPVGDRHHQRVQHQVSAVVRRGAPPGDQPGERVDDERGIGGARPGGHEGEVDHPQPVRRIRREAAVHQVRRPGLGRVGHRGP